MKWYCSDFVEKKLKKSCQIMESDINIDIEEGEAPLVEVKVCTIYKNICTKSCTWTFL